MWKQRWMSFVRFIRRETNPVRRSLNFAGGFPVTEETAMQISAFHRGVTYISSQIAKLPWEVKDKDNKVISDRTSQLLNLAPNGEMTAMSWRLAMVANAIVHGNGYAEIERDLAGRPIALWPIPSRYVEPYRSPDGKLVYRIIAGSYFQNNNDVFIPVEDMFHIKNFHTKDGLVGQGVVAYAAETLGISLGADRMAGNLFSNGGMPSGVLETTATLSDEAFARVKESWKENHGGKRSGGVAILEEGMKFNPLSVTPDLLQFLESRKFGVLEIARFLGLPPTKLFDTDAATFSNIENANLEVATDTLDAWAKMLEAEADVKVLNYQYGGRFSKMDLYEIFRGDMTTRANYFTKMMQCAAITPNQIREKEGLPPAKDGDRYYLAVNNFSPVDRVDEIIDSQIAKNTAPPPAKTTAPADQKLTQAAIHYLEKNK